MTNHHHRRRRRATRARRGDLSRATVIAMLVVSSSQARLQQRLNGWDPRRHGGTSGEHGRWCNFRNVTWMGKPVDGLDVPPVFAHALLDVRRAARVASTPAVTSSRGDASRLHMRGALLGVRPSACARSTAGATRVSC